MDWLRIVSRPGMPDSTTSSGIVTCRSTSSAEAARILGDDLDDRRRRVGVRLDVDIQKRVETERREGQRRQDDDQPIADGPVDEVLDHPSPVRL